MVYLKEAGPLFDMKRSWLSGLLSRSLTANGLSVYECNRS